MVFRNRVHLHCAGKAGEDPDPDTHGSWLFLFSLDDQQCLDPYSFYPDPDPDPIRIQRFDDQQLKKLHQKKIKYFLEQKLQFTYP
jgi:hypothetical protein